MNPINDRVRKDCRCMFSKHFSHYLTSAKPTHTIYKAIVRPSFFFYLQFYTIILLCHPSYYIILLVNVIK